MSKPTIFGPIGLMLVIGISILPAWWFGGVAAQYHLWVFWASVAVLICCQFSSVRELRLPTITTPLTLGVLVGLLQLVPLSPGVHADASPTGAELWTSLVPVSSPVEQRGETMLRDRVGLAPVAAGFPISLYPASTRRDLSLLLLATTVFFAGSQLIATPIAQCIYCGAIALNGAALAFFGLAQQLSWNGKLYWCVPFEAGTPFASFVNRNNAAGFLNLCLAGAIGLCVWAVSRTAVSDRDDGYPGQPGDRWRLASRKLVRFVASLDATTLTAFTSSIVIIAGILCSLSRGGWISLTVAAIVTLTATLVAQRGGRPRLSWLAVAALACLLLVGWLGKSDVVQQRLSTLLDYRQTLTDRRLPHWQDGFHAAQDFWRVGSGLGTYRYVYSLYQERSDDAWYYHAENQYLETLVEAGLPGLLLLLSAMGLMGLVCWRLLREPPQRTSYALGITATFALASQSVHAIFDFGLYIPANMLLFALLCGAAAGQAARLEADLDVRLKSTWTAWRSRLIFLPPVTGVTRAFVPLLFFAVLLASFEVRKVAAVEAAIHTTKAVRVDEMAPREADLVRSIRQLTAALQNCPDDAEGQLLLARLWTERYQLDASDADTSPFAKRLSDTGYLRSWLLNLQHNNRSADFAALQTSAPVVHNLTNSVRHLLLARDACPIVPRVHLALAELAVAIDQDDLGHLERTYSLASWDQRILLHAAAFALQSHRPDLAIACYRRCLKQSPAQLPAVLKLAAEEVDLHPHLDQLLPDDLELLVATSREFQTDSMIRTKILAKADSLAQQTHDLSEPERLRIQGTLSSLHSNNRQAIHFLSQAIQLSPEMTSWRYELAILLQTEGMASKALEQAQLCVGMEPENQTYSALLNELIKARVARAAEFGT
jgi:O-antigen ligase